MKIELKKIQMNFRASEETTMFVADLYIDDKKCGVAKNDGHGGSTRYMAIMPRHVDLIKKAEKYCESLPDKQVAESKEYNHGAFSIKMNLAHFLDDLVGKEIEVTEKKKFLQKMKRDCLYGICYGTEEGYRTIKWNITIDKLLKTPAGVEAFKKRIEQVHKSMTQGEKILNTNIPNELL